MKTILLSFLLCFAAAEPACDTRTSDERGSSEVKPGENPAPDSKVQPYAEPPQKHSYEAQPTFEPQGGEQ